MFSASCEETQIVSGESRRVSHICLRIASISTMPPALSDVSGVPVPATPCESAMTLAPDPGRKACVSKPSKASALSELSDVPSEAAVCVPVAVAAIAIEAIALIAPSNSAPAAPQNQA